MSKKVAYFIRALQVLHQVSKLCLAFVPLKQVWVYLLDYEYSTACCQVDIFIYDNKKRTFILRISGTFNTECLFVVVAYRSTKPSEPFPDSHLSVFSPSCFNTESKLYHQMKTALKTTREWPCCAISQCNVILHHPTQPVRSNRRYQSHSTPRETSVTGVFYFCGSVASSEFN